MQVLLLQQEMGKYKTLRLKLLKITLRAKPVANSYNSEKYLEAKVFTVP